MIAFAKLVYFNSLLGQVTVWEHEKPPWAKSQVSFLVSALKWCEIFNVPQTLEIYFKMGSIICSGYFTEARRVSIRTTGFQSEFGTSNT